MNRIKFPRGIEVIKIPLKKIDKFLIENEPRGLSLKTFHNEIIYKNIMSIWSDEKTGVFGFQKDIINSNWQFLNGKNTLVSNNEINYPNKLFDCKKIRRAIGVNSSHLYILNMKKTFLNMGISVKELAIFMKKELNCSYAVELHNKKFSKVCSEKYINIFINNKEFKTVVSSYLNIHTLPVESSKILGSYNIGTLIETFENHGEWIKTAHGWVLEKYLV